MKRTYILLFLICFITALSQSDEVTSVNWVGYKRIVVPTNSYAQIAIQFDSIDPANASLMGVFGTNTLRGGPNSSFCDLIILWDTGEQIYRSFGLRDTDMHYYCTSNWPASIEDDYTILSGEAFWIQTAAFGDYSTQELEFAMVGEVVSDATRTQNVVAGYQLMGYLFSCDVPINDLTFTNATKSDWGSECDRIFIWNGTQYERYGMKSDGFWYDLDNWTNPPVTNEIELGHGFWYDAKSGFSCDETNRYINNL